MNDPDKMEEIDRRIGFSAMKKAIMEDGAIDRRTKKLLAIASAVAVGCDTCFITNSGYAKDAGISDEEIQEAILVASLIRMGSGLNYTWKTINKE
ncbi:carboxymuconolactone decarboxylase family protein [Methanolobus profundi]|uniref:Alkylhydroperoxidase AhpD family core domain-containing protein n=1 Tax=Methanolobus profundi TaxID=487685 RepID=A0A1I4U8E0_9EURY|nr:carboxymuconolactone decarboxylase family protein [Methanolobus profundi]SFM85185.1 alkylhydroperoxidase AhpD family core domain-containing protein [Methanolobus profundi]